MPFTLIADEFGSLDTLETIQRMNWWLRASRAEVWYREITPGELKGQLPWRGRKATG